jgi:hypothetical protein
MKTIPKIAVVGIALVLMLMADVPLPYVQLVPEAHAILGTRRRTAVVAYSAGKSSGSQQAAASQQEAAAAEKEAAAAKQEAAAAKQQAAAAPPAPPPGAAGTPLPLGTVVSALPAGCASTPVGGVQYYYCGGNFYRAVFQGNTLVYVTAQPK